MHPQNNIEKVEQLSTKDELSEPWWWNNSLPEWKTLNDNERALAYKCGKRIFHLFKD